MVPVYEKYIQEKNFVLYSFVEERMRYKTAYSILSMEIISNTIDGRFSLASVILHFRSYQCAKCHSEEPCGTHAKFSQKLRLVSLYHTPKFQLQNRKAPYLKVHNTELDPPS